MVILGYSDLLKERLQQKQLGKVTQIFNRGINICFQEQLIYISDNNQYFSPFSLSISTQNLTDLKAVIAVGQVVRLVDHCLTFYTKKGQVEASLLGSMEVSTKLIIAPISKEDAQHYRQEMQTFLAKHLANGLELSLVGCKTEADNAQTQLLQGLRQENSQETAQSVHYFYGRGGGLTPSGDDYLVGLYATLAMNQQGAFLKRMFQAELQRKEATTSVAAAYYQAAAAGYVNQLLGNLLVHMAQAKVIQKDMQQLLNYGYTSGVDLLMGVYAGLGYFIQ